VPENVRVIVWDLRDPAPDQHIDLVIPAYSVPRASLDTVVATGTKYIQSQSIGYDGVSALLPAGVVYLNAAGVHETSTAELAVLLALADLRGLPDFVRAQARHDWTFVQHMGLADRRVLLLGYGGIGKAVEARLSPFEVEVVRVARTARDGETGPIHGMAELPTLLPEADVVIASLPLDDNTRGMVGDFFLNAMKKGSLLINVGRGPVVDTEALVRATRSGHIRAALDVVDPEPLPADHPLWDIPGVLLVPHVGGGTGAMMPRMTRLVHEQIGRLLRGEEPANIVLRT
jgi:phosphoglycerate dehydrogenase-like enzyme